MVQQFIRPCAPVLRRTPPTGPDWVYEVKWDGWRVQIHKDNGTVRLFPRPGNDMTSRFPGIAAAVADLPRRSMILDGELVAFN